MIVPSVDTSPALSCCVATVLWRPRCRHRLFLPLAPSPTVAPSTSHSHLSSPTSYRPATDLALTAHAWLTTGRLTRVARRGFGLVFVSAIPTRMLYLGTLERVKSDLNKALPDSTDATSRASITNFVAGGVASMCSQLLVVPVDVISQRLMVKVGLPPSRLVPATRALSEAVENCAALMCLSPGTTLVSVHRH
jgi:hypothetical protein